MARPEKYHIQTEFAQAIKCHACGARVTEDFQFLKIRSWKSIRRVVQWMDMILDTTIMPYKRNRSLQQNRWLWGVAYISIAAQWKEKYGETLNPNAIHAHNLKIVQGFEPKFKTMGEDQIMYFESSSSSKWKSAEFNERKQILQDWYWDEHEIDIPDPQGACTINDYL